MKEEEGFRLVKDESLSKINKMNQMKMKMKMKMKLKMKKKKKKRGYS